MRARVTLAAVALVLVASVAAGWVVEHTSAPRTATATSAASAYHVRITERGHELASLDVAALEAIGMRSVKVQGGAEQGPPVLDVLRRAGVTDFKSITVLGTGARDSGRLDLPRSDIGPDTVLDVAKRGTVKIVGPAIPWAKRVRDITEIQVQ